MNIEQKIDLANDILFTNKPEWNRHRFLIYLFLILGICSIGLIEKEQKANIKAPMASEEDLAIQTLIPAGYTLLPIEIANSKSLDSIFGSYGIVDLFVGTTADSSELKLIAKRVKLLRAPKNHNVFAVLVKRSESSSIYKYPGPFFVSLLAHTDNGTEFVTKKEVAKVLVEYISPPGEKNVQNNQD